MSVLRNTIASFLFLMALAAIGLARFGAQAHAAQAIPLDGVGACPKACPGPNSTVPMTCFTEDKEEGQWQKECVKK